ncbi:MAG: malonyl-CoA decarboxylase [Alphaproteobacteria bacterium]|nr:malonyl-CoA decarboxylase [Alphaproteobacteria bacterium]
MNTSFLQELLNAVAEQGRALLPKSLFGDEPEKGMQALVDALVSGRGEASGVAIAQQILKHYQLLGAEEKRAYFRYLAAAPVLRPDADAVLDAAEGYVSHPSDAALATLQAAVDSPRQEFFRRLNLAPGATAEIVAMRRDLLRLPKDDASLAAVDNDLRHLFYSWFNRGFLVLRRIDWQTPAAILEKIIAYEAVHEIKGWDDLRRRLDPADRRCFAFFHPSLVDEPLIFVEVALGDEITGAIEPVLNEERKAEPLREPTTAVFYSISNCQEGLLGISFGNFLIKQVVEELVRELPSLKTFVTLSPVPVFARWLDRVRGEDAEELLSEEDRKVLARLRDPEWADRHGEDEALKDTVMALAAHYFMRAKSDRNKPVDPVARFHLGNGARLERINWLGDASDKGLRQAHGLMVNYRYEIKDIEKNHEAYANNGTIAASRGVKSLLRQQKGKGGPETGSVLMLPSAVSKSVLGTNDADGVTLERAKKGGAAEDV